MAARSKARPEPTVLGNEYFRPGQLGSSHHHLRFFPSHQTTPTSPQSATLPQQFQQSAAASICCPPPSSYSRLLVPCVPALITACQTPAQEDFSAIFTLRCAAHLSTPIKEYFKDSKAQLVTYMNFSASIIPPPQVLHARQGTLSHYQKSYLDFGF